MASASTDWIEWQGGICPVDVHTEVEYRLRWFTDGQAPYRCAAGHCRWDHGRTPESASDPSMRVSDIVSYRVVQA